MTSPEDRPAPTADEALARLVEGNRRFLEGRTTITGVRKELLDSLTEGQRPYATILGCSDSRVPPEWIFDAGLGELFVVRVAGNVLSGEVAGSLQYAGAHLRTPLVVVLGHEGCGAVQAALATKFEGVEHRSRIQILVDSLQPALSGLEAGLPSEERLARAVEKNVRWCVHQILESPEGRARVAEGWMKCVGAIYEISSGRVRFLA
jgi:carbonic anhydrase